MTDDDFRNLEHKLDKADDDLTALTKDVVALKADNANLVGAMRETLKCIILMGELYTDDMALKVVHGKREKYNELVEIMRRLSDRFPHQA